jgi:tagatose 1,6-diphosphate aldolase
MAVTPCPGKKRRLQAVSDSRGVIAALACDQRQALRGLFAKALGVNSEDVGGERLIEFKEAVARILSPHASAILLDPEFGLPAAGQRAKTTGLLLACEQTGHASEERLPRRLDQWPVQRLLEEGADCVKLLLYYSTASRLDVNEAKHDFVEKLGAECAAADVPLFLELVVYAEGIDVKGPEFAAQKPSVLAASMAEFSRPRYQVDVLKVGIPVNLAYVEGAPGGTGRALYRREDAIAHYRRVAAATHLPFIYLSEGVSNETFRFGLELASEAGAKFSGVLCGRATWKDGVAVLVKNGNAALEDWLSGEGVRNIENVNQCLHGATPWFNRGDKTLRTKDQECFSA